VGGIQVMDGCVFGTYGSNNIVMPALAVKLKHMGRQSKGRFRHGRVDNSIMTNNTKFGFQNGGIVFGQLSMTLLYHSHI